MEQLRSYRKCRHDFLYRRNHVCYILIAHAVEHRQADEALDKHLPRRDIGRRDIQSDCDSKDEDGRECNGR